MNVRLSYMKFYPNYFSQKQSVEKSSFCRIFVSVTQAIIITQTRLQRAAGELDSVNHVTFL